LGPFALAQLDLRVLAISGDAHPPICASASMPANSRQNRRLEKEGDVMGGMPPLGYAAVRVCLNPK
jgi:hypothetical protein